MNDHLPVHEINRQQKLCDYHSTDLFTEIGASAPLFQNISESASFLVIHQNVDVPLSFIDFKEFQRIPTILERPLNSNFVN